jgi:hypothetical protein
MVHGLIKIAVFYLLPSPGDVEEAVVVLGRTGKCFIGIQEH